MNIEDFKLELIVLQKADTKNAREKGFKNKNKWFKFISHEPHDEIAEAVLNLAKKYNLEDTVVANFFDETMLYRIERVKHNYQEMTM